MGKKNTFFFRSRNYGKMYKCRVVSVDLCVEMKQTFLLTSILCLFTNVFRLQDHSSTCLWLHREIRLTLNEAVK